MFNYIYTRGPLNVYHTVGEWERDNVYGLKWEEFNNFKHMCFKRVLFCLHPSTKLYKHTSYTGNNKINWIECVWTWLTPWESLKIIVKFYKLMSFFPLNLFHIRLRIYILYRTCVRVYILLWVWKRARMARAMQNLWISKKHLPQKPIEREVNWIFKRRVLSYWVLKFCGQQI